MHSKKYALNEGKTGKGGNRGKKGACDRAHVSLLYVRPQLTIPCRAYCLGTLTQQILKHVFGVNTYSQQQIHGQLLLQEGRLILKCSLMAFHCAQN